MARPPGPDDRLRCQACGDVIGAYERLIAVLPDRGPVDASKLKLGELCPDTRPPCYHETCFRGA